MEGQKGVHEIGMSLHSMQAVFSIMHVGVLRNQACCWVQHLYLARTAADIFHLA